MRGRATAFFGTSLEAGDLCGQQTWHLDNVGSVLTGADICQRAAVWCRDSFEIVLRLGRQVVPVRQTIDVFFPAREHSKDRFAVQEFIHDGGEKVQHFAVATVAGADS